MGPNFWGRGGRRGSVMAPFKKAMVISYRLPIVTVALSVTIQPQFIKWVMNYHDKNLYYLMYAGSSIKRKK